MKNSFRSIRFRPNKDDDDLRKLASCVKVLHCIFKQIRLGPTFASATADPSLPFLRLLSMNPVNLKIETLTFGSV